MVLDVDQLEHDVEAQKEAEEKKHESLEVLKEKITEEAEDSLKKTFGDK